MRIELNTAPAQAAITLADVKTYAFMNTDAYDNKINSLIEPATKYLEKHIGRRLINQVYDIWYDRDEYTERLNAYNNSLTLYSFNVSAIISVTSYDPSNNSNVIASGDYRQSGGIYSAESNLVYNDFVNIDTNLRIVDAICVQVTTGYGVDSTTVPEPLKQALAVLIQHWINNGQKNSSSDRPEVPTNFVNLILPYMSMEAFV